MEMTSNRKIPKKTSAVKVTKLYHKSWFMERTT